MRYHTLIVDDDFLIRYAVERLMHTMGLTALVTASVAQALSAIQQHTFDLLMSDLILTNGSGYEVIGQFNAKFPSGKTIILTGQTTSTSFVNTARFNISDFLIKPVDKDTLERAIRLALNMDQPKPTVTIGAPILFDEGLKERLDGYIHAIQKESERGSNAEH